jgi:hypothetical protein
VDEGTVPVVCEGGGRKYAFESLLEQAGNSADDSKKTSNVRDLIFTKAGYQFEKRLFYEPNSLNANHQPQSP